MWAAVEMVACREQMVFDHVRRRNRKLFLDYRAQRTRKRRRAHSEEHKEHIRVDGEGKEFLLDYEERVKALHAAADSEYERTTCRRGMRDVLREFARDDALARNLPWPPPLPPPPNMAHAWHEDRIHMYPAGSTPGFRGGDFDADFVTAHAWHTVTDGINMYPAGSTVRLLQALPI